MPSEDLKKVREVISAMPDDSESSIDELRARLDRLAELFPLSENFSVEKIQVNTIPGEWVKAPIVRDGVVILYLHGGGYVRGSTASHRHLVGAISEAAKSSVLSIDYRLAPEFPFPAAVEDCLEAYRWILKNGFSPNQVGVAGDSSGACLALAVALCLRDAGEPVPATIICISPPIDGTMSSDSWETKAETDPLVNKEKISLYRAMYDADPTSPLASPIFADLSGLPPILIQVGSEEVLLDDSIKLDQKARDAGIESTLEIWDEMIHCWHLFAPMLKEGRDAINRIGEYFLSRVK